MPRTRRPYPPEFRARMIELVRAGRSPEELATEFEPTSTTIRHWVQQADRDAGRRGDGLTTEEREELRRLRRELRQVKLEREILAKATAWFARETGSIPCPPNRGTSKQTYDIGPDSVERWLRALRRDQPLVITGIGFDWVAGRFLGPVRDPLALARHFYAFYPDVVDHGTGTVEALARELRRTGVALYCWWD